MSAVVLAALVESLAMQEQTARGCFFYSRETVTAEQVAIVWNNEEPEVYARYCHLLAIAKAASPAAVAPRFKLPMIYAHAGYRFANIECSACGEAFGPGDAGYSHCRDHKGLRAVR